MHCIRGAVDCGFAENMKKHEAVLSEQKRMLVELMDMYYGQYGKGVVVDDSNREKYRNRFKALPSDADLVMYLEGLYACAMELSL